MKFPTIITLTTDFGHGSAYVAEMKGAILSINPAAQIVDATHDVEPQNVLQGALCLRQFAKTFPPSSVHVAVVDPGVGSSREILLVEWNERLFIGPNNGLLTFQLDEASRVLVADQPSYWRAQVSSTFHGRDIMGPLAAHLTNGATLEQVSSRFPAEPVRLSLPKTVRGMSEQAPTLSGEIISVDSFGNLLTNISATELAEMGEFQVKVAERIVPFKTTYSEAGSNQLLALIGSNDWLEIAVNGGNASDHLCVSVGEPVIVVAGGPS
jgi:S-adenosylmethionine hydrolase